MGRRKVSTDEKLKEGGIGENEKIQETYREELQNFREDVLREIKEQLDPDRVLERLMGKTQNQTDSWMSNERAKLKGKNSGINGKIFTARESELTDLLKITHIATIYNVFVATLITLFLSTVIHDMINTGSVNLGFELLWWNFSPFPISVLIWLEMMVLVIGLYYGHFFWARTRASIHSTKIREKLDKVALVFLIAFYVIFLCLPPTQVRLLNLPFACSAAVVMEQVRLIMKTYAYVRTNVPRTLAFAANDKESFFVPTFDKYLYFLFAPTLIYRDDYPRTSHIRWSYALARFGEVFCIILYISFIAERYILPIMRDFGKPGVPFVYIVAMVIDNSLPSIIGLVCIFYAILHAWLNGMAEILRFADRMFYQDWWNTAAYAEYYKTWNIVVYDWLYTFIYKDAGGILFENRTAKAVLVIAVSALFHEYIMAVSLGYLVPGFIIVYGLGGPLVMQLTSRSRTIGNVYIWFTLAVGSGLMNTLYLAEYYARISCPRTIESPVMDFFIPRMATCPYSQQ